MPGSKLSRGYKVLHVPEIWPPGAALQEQHEQGLIIGMDANAKSHRWFSGRTDERGGKLEELISKHDLEVANVRQEYTTFAGPVGNSNIDVTLTKGRVRHQIQNWRVEDGVTQSDHNLILFDIVPGTKESLENRRPLQERYRIQKGSFATLKKKMKLVMDRLEGTPNSAHQTEKYAENITKAIQSACDETFRTIQQKRRIAPWWSGHLEKYKRICYRARRAMQRAKDIDDRIRKKAIYKQARGDYSRVVWKAKREAWQEFVETQSEKNIWRVVQKVLEKGQRPGEIATTSRELATKTWHDVADHLLSHFLKKDHVEEDTIEQGKMRTEAQEILETDKSPEVDEAEVAEIITSLRNKKTPGLDRIENEVLKVTTKIITPRLTTLYRACLRYRTFPEIWKKARIITLLKGNGRDRGDVSSYRPICLLPALSKVLEKILKTRILSEIRSNKNQYGFTKGKNTTDAVERLFDLKIKSKDKCVVAILIDIRAAFDSLWWPHVLTVLARRRCPQDVHGVLMDYFKNREVVLVDGVRSMSRAQERGCPQGSVLGPTMWNIVFDELLQVIENETERIPVA